MANSNPSPVDRNPAVKVYMGFFGRILLMVPYVFVLEVLRPENIESLEDLAHGVHLFGKVVILTIFVLSFAQLFASPEFQQHVRLFNRGYELAFEEENNKRQAKVTQVAEPKTPCAKTS